jgi:hypothetical protein
MERDGLAPTLIMIIGLQRSKVPQAATDACRYLGGGLLGPAKTCKGDVIPYNSLTLTCLWKGIMGMG